jgi:ribosomal protein S12 methylthiotransferase
MKINIITLGCSKNTADSEHLAGHLKKAGFEVYFDRAQKDCDIIIVNTCGFIGDAKEESVNTLLEQIDIKQRGRKQRKIFAVGCLVERYREELRAELPEIDGFYGVHQWDEIVKSLKADFHEQLEKERLQSTPGHYAYLKIAEGCNRNCSYCAIPMIRGKHKSRPIEDLVAEAKEMVANGVKEIIVIAQDTTYYGLDLYGERRLGELLDRLATESGAEWIRLHYTYPSSFPDDAIDAIARHDNICKYIDIPLQHINSRLLSSMQRGINREATLSLLEKFREKIPNVAIRTTLIVGYPGETEAEFEELKTFVRDARFNRMGVFAYSPEEGTPAYKLGDPVSDEEKQRRIDELMTIQDAIALQYNEQKVGKTFRVIVDRREGDYFIGRTEQDSPEVDDEVLIHPHSSLHIGQFAYVTIQQAVEHDLFATVVTRPTHKK